jgi:hypothetical protein
VTVSAAPISRLPYQRARLVGGGSVEGERRDAPPDRRAGPAASLAAGRDQRQQCGLPRIEQVGSSPTCRSAANAYRFPNRG